eukprot:Awhi_evm1s9405
MEVQEQSFLDGEKQINKEKESLQRQLQVEIRKNKDLETESKILLDKVSSLKAEKLTSQ